MNSEGLSTFLPVTRNMLRNNVEAVLVAAEAYGKDEEYRSRVESDPHAALAEKGVDVPPGYEVRIVVNTKDTFYIPFPPDPNTDLSDEDLSIVAGGKSASTIGSAGTASTVSTVPTTFSSVACISSAGSAGTSG